ncbi:MAG TPA: serine/threonine-protein kinase, partial [Candidatus Angelobacter sp.]|nr:serine/threonine-protein kinase [Candidatus Angelobacter sp.]
DALRQRLEKLLEASDELGDFLDKPFHKMPGDLRSVVSFGEKPGNLIGRYKLIEQIGEGGCGVVFMAKQQEPVRRQVALKIIKPGMDSKSVIARFEAERQALALMNHPNIAKVLDAGATESGRPYFVMELIHGVKITEYCDQNSLTTGERLKLFVQVCQAIQHAHQKGIIHRDIKPSNILVAITSKGEPLPVVIDFGIAKATNNQELTDKTLFTAFEMLIGTPAYMSPEQATLGSVDIDIRTDIYSLGVLLYELLTGSTPFDTTELPKVGLDEIRRVIREQEPVRPSTRLVKMTGADLKTVAQRRKAEPTRLIRAVSGDLDWIVMKALEKDRTRRYETAYGMALDINRYLANEPVSARPPGRLYKFRKTVLRHKLLFVAGGVITAFLVASLVIVSAALAREREARREAEANMTRAETAAVKSGQVTHFLEDMLQGVGPSYARGRDTTMLQEILDRSARRVGNDLTNQPEVEAELRSRIGQLYLQIGKYPESEQMQRAALAIDQKLYGAGSAESAASFSDLGLVFWKEGKLADAAEAHRQALTIRRQLFGTNNADTAGSLNALASIYTDEHKLTEAEAMIREALAIRRSLFKGDNLEVADSLNSLCLVLEGEGRWAEAEATARELVAMRRRLSGNEDMDLAEALKELALAEGYDGKLDEEEAAFDEAFAIQHMLLPEEHPYVVKDIADLGEIMRVRGKLPEAHAVLKAAISIQSKLLGEDYPDTLSSLGSLAQILEAEGNWTEAETVNRGALTLWRHRAGDQNPSTLWEVGELVRDLAAEKKYAEAEQLLNESLTPALVAQPSSADLLALRSDLMACRGRWQQAAADAALAVKFQPNEHYRCHTLAGLLVITHNRLEYEKLCQRMLPVFADTSNPYIAERVADDCLLLPDSGVDLQVVDKLATRTVTIGNDASAMGYFQACKALSEYRQAKYSAAVVWAEKTLKTDQAFAQAKGYAVLAMAQWQLGQKDVARTALAEGNTLAPGISHTNGAVDLGDSWVAWLFARITLDEAGQLIEPASPTDRNSNKP